MDLLNIVIHLLRLPTGYEPFNRWYYSALAVFVVLAIGLVITPPRIRQHRVFRAAIALPPMLAVLGSCYLYHVVPLHLCHMTGILVVPCAILLQRRLFQYMLIYLSGWAALLALLTPNLAQHTSMIRYLIFFIIHGFIVLNTLFVYCVHRPAVTTRSFIHVLVAFNLYTACVGLIDHVFQMNYIYLATPPDSVPGLLPWPWYIGQTELLLLCLSLVTYLSIQLVARMRYPTSKISLMKRLGIIKPTQQAKT